MGFHTIRNRILLVMGCAAAVAGICLAAAFGFSELGWHEASRQALSSSFASGGVSRQSASSSAQNAEKTGDRGTARVQPLPATGKVVYMTFDDGPSDLTVPLLNILDRYHVKATFFVVGVYDRNEAADLKEIVKRGQAIGVHSYSHDYKKIYASSTAFFTDVDKMHEMIFRDTGVDTRLLRFAGGSVNDYDRKLCKELKAGLKQRGYVYYDWNASSGDASDRPTARTILNDALKGVRQHRVSVVLFHNSAPKKATLSAVPKFIETLQREGYRFASLDPPVDNTPFVFSG